MDKYKEGNCTICEQYFTLLHWHHTVPQALGGKDSLQIPLCSQCHNLLHAHAEAIVAFRRTGRKIVRSYWQTSTEESNAAPYLAILVGAITNAADVVGKTYVMQFKATAALHNALQLFKMDSGQGSLEKAILLSLSEFLRAKGYLADEHPEQHKQRNSIGPDRSKAPLW